MGERSRIDALSAVEREGFWPLSPDVAIEVVSGSDAFRETVARIALFIERGTAYAVVVDPVTREVVEMGSPPTGLELDLDAIIDA